MRTGVNAEQYDLFWQMMSNRDLATLYLTIFMGKLLQMEDNALQLMLSKRMTSSAPNLLTRTSSSVDMPDPATYDLGTSSSSQLGASPSSTPSSTATTATSGGDTFPEMTLNGRESVGDVTDFRGSMAEPRGSIADSRGRMSSASERDAPETCSLDVFEIINEMQIGKHSANPNHPLLLKRKESVLHRNFSLVIDKDEDVTTPVGKSTTASSTLSSQSSMVHDKQWFTTQQLFLRSTLINSMIYLSMFYRFDFSNASLLHLVHTWTKLRQQTFQQRENMDKVDSVAEELRDDLIRLQSTSALFKYVQLCIDYSVMRDEELSLFAPLNRYDPLTMVASYAYSNLQTISRVPDYTNIIMDDILQSLDQSLDDDMRTRNILNFVRIMVPQLHFINSDCLQSLIEKLKPHAMKPMPVGTLIRDTMLLSQREMRCHGAAMRERFERSVQRVVMDDGTVTHKRRIVHILFNGYAENASNLSDRVSLENDFDEIEIDIVKANLLLNMFDELGEDTVSQLAQMPFDTLSRYYADASAIMEEAEVRYMNRDPAQEVTAALQDNLQRLCSSILNDVTSNRETLNARRKSPQMPEVEIKLIDLEREEDMTTCPREYKIFPRSCMVDVLDNIVKEQRATQHGADVLTIDIAIAGGSGTMQHFVHSVFVAQRLKMLKDVSIRLYVIPLGENNFLSNWLEKYDGWYSRHVHYPFLSTIPMVPALKTDNEPAQFSNDAAKVRRGSDPLIKSSAPVNRTTMQSFLFKPYAKRAKAIIPDYHAPKSFFTPHRFMRSLLNNYFIDAYQPLAMHYYNVQCLSNEVVSVASPGMSEGEKGNKQQQQIQKMRSKVKEYVSICFSQHLTVGIIAETLQAQKSEPMDDVSLEEFQAKYGGISLVMSYVPMDSTGELSRTSEIQEPGKTYYSITVQSVSCQGDRGSLVAPSQPWLEVSAEEFSMKKKRSKSKESETIVNYHVGSISIESTSVHQFSVAMDGEIYGPFHKILINPSTTTIDLQTFNNVDLF